MKRSTQCTRFENSYSDCTSFPCMHAYFASCIFSDIFWWLVVPLVRVSPPEACRTSREHAMLVKGTSQYNDSFGWVAIIICWLGFLRRAHLGFGIMYYLNALLWHRRSCINFIKFQFSFRQWLPHGPLFFIFFPPALNKHGVVSIFSFDKF